MTALAARWRALTILALAILAAVVVAWQLIPIPSWNGAINALVLCGPILAPSIGIWRGNRYTFRWATLCVVPYFVVALTEVIANPMARGWSAAMLLCALFWFVTLVAFLRVTALPAQRQN